MTEQLAFLDTSRDTYVNAGGLPEGLHYCDELIRAAEETALVGRIRGLPFKEFEFHGFKGKRRTVSFGWQYEFSGRGSLRKADDIPEFLLPLRAAAAKFGQMEPQALQHVLVIEYCPGAGIGWHRDKPVFGQVVGISLLAPCVLRFRRKLSSGGSSDKARTRSVSDRAPGVSIPGESNRILRATSRTWDRVNILAQPRSAYHLTGPARSEWEHSILRVDALRYAITFRTMRED